MLHFAFCIRAWFLVSLARLWLSLMRYRLHEHPAFPGLLSKEDLYLLVERGTLARGDLCQDSATGRDHTVGDVISGVHAGRARAASTLDRPRYREFRADSDDDVFFASPPSATCRDLDEQPFTEESEDENLPIEEPDPEEEESEPHFKPSEKTAAGELLYYQGHPAWLGASKAMFLMFLLFVCTLMLIPIEPEFAMVSGLCAVAVFLGVAMTRLSREYLVTEERVEVVWGILGRSSKEVRICDIRSMDVYEKGVKGLLGLGNVDFSSAANAGIEVQFRDIRHAHDVKELVRQLQRTQGSRND